MTQSNQLKRLVVVRKNLLLAMVKVAGKATPELRETWNILNNALAAVGEVRAGLSHYPAYSGDSSSPCCRFCGARSGLMHNGDFYHCVKCPTFDN